MEVKKLKILNSEGLHARPAGVFAKAASSFQSKVSISFNGKTINAKSAMSLMTLGLSQDHEITLQTEGPDAVEALSKLSHLIENKFILE